MTDLEILAERWKLLYAKAIEEEAVARYKRRLEILGGAFVVFVAFFVPFLLAYLILGGR